MEISEKRKVHLKKNNAESNYITREAIRDALYILMRKKDFNDIRITEIIKKSGVSRSAFYRNFKSKEDILYDTLDELDRVINQGMTNSLSGNWTSTFYILRQNREKLELIIKARLEHDKKSGTDFVKAMNKGLIYNVIIYWAKSGMLLSDKEAAMLIVNSYKTVIEDLKEYAN